MPKGSSPRFLLSGLREDEGGGKGLDGATVAPSCECPVTSSVVEERAEEVYARRRGLSMSS